MKKTHMNQSRLGLILIIFTSIFYATNPSLSKYHYMAGGDALSFLFFRFLITSLLLYLIITWRKKKHFLSRKQKLTSCALGLIIFAISYLYIFAIKFIPAGLATILLFTYPLWVGILSWINREEPMSWQKLSALCVAFIGLVLCIGLEFESLDWRGIALGLGAGLGLSFNVFYGNRVIQHMDGFNFTYYMMIACLIFTIPLILITPPSFPITSLGWVNLVAASIFFCAGLLMFFTALPMLGPIKASLFNNLEPVFSIILAFFILGEILTPIQYLGSALVISAIVLIQIKPKREKS
jgi:drug/metabolite transporter (DMT)-like permease